MSVPTAQAPTTTPLATQPQQPRPRRGRLLGGAIAVACLAVAGIVIAVTDPFATSASSNGGADNGAPTTLATVAQRGLSSQVQVNGTLGYAGSYTILNQASGAFTRLPAAGQVIEPGHVAYWFDGTPVVLLYGHTPVYRALSEGMSGPDVKQLNTDLVALGYLSSSQLDPISDYYSSATAYGIAQLQAHLGVTETGSLTLGAAVFEPGAMRITSVTARLGAQAGPGAPVAQASSTERQVVVPVGATQQASVRTGDHVAITLPDNSVTPGVVSSVGTVASGGSGSSSPTVDVDVRPLHPGATGRLDQAPVQVAITTASAHNALVVPVEALLALASGGYAVEEVGPRDVHQLVPVTLGLFDDADGLVQVSGSGLAGGQQVVVPASP